MSNVVTQNTNLSDSLNWRKAVFSTNGESPNRFKFYRSLYDCGFNLIAIRDGEEKQPLTKYKKWQTERMNEEAAMYHLGKCEAENMNMGIITGLMPWHDFGIVVVDCDDERAREVAIENLGETPVHQKTNKGVHLVYRHPRNCRIRNIQKVEITGKPFNCDLKGDGGLWTAPFSHHRLGTTYTPNKLWTRNDFLSAPVFDPQWFDDVVESVDATMTDAELHTAAVEKHRLPVNHRMKQFRSYLETQPGTQEGNGADNRFYRLALTGAWDYLLPANVLFSLLYEWGQRDDQKGKHGGYEPWDRKQVEHKVKDAVCCKYDGTPGGKLDLGEWEIEQIYELFAKQPTSGATEPEPETGTNNTTSQETHDDTTPDDGDKPDHYVKMRTWNETCEIAAGQQTDWLIPGWCEFGCLHLLTGLPFSGKSSIVASIIGSMASGHKWAEYNIPPVPFVLLDLENKERILVKRLRRELIGQHQMDKLFHQADPADIPRPLTAEYIVKCIRTIGTPKGLVVVDTMRSAFAADELDPAKLLKVLNPLKQLAQVSNWAVILLHHNNKHKNEYSGNTTIAAIPDYLWNWTRIDHTMRAELSWSGRDDVEDSMIFEYCKSRQTNLYVGRKGGIKKEEQENRAKDKLVEFAKIVPPTESAAKSESEIVNESIYGRHVVQNVLKEGSEKGWWTRCGTGTKGDSYRYYLTAVGISQIQQSGG